MQHSLTHLNFTEKKRVVKTVAKSVKGLGQQTGVLESTLEGLTSGQQGFVDQAVRGHALTHDAPFAAPRRATRRPSPHAHHPSPTRTAQATTQRANASLMATATCGLAKTGVKSLEIQRGLQPIFSKQVRINA